MVARFRICRRSRKVPAETVARFRTLPVNNFSGSGPAYSRSDGPSLRPIHARGVMAGPDLIGKTTPGDIRKALAIADPGAIIGADAGGDLTNSIIGQIRVPIAIGGMVIEPGDLVIGDGDGLVSVPFTKAEDIGAAVEAKHQAEHESLAGMRAAELPDRVRVDETLRRPACTIEPA